MVVSPCLISPLYLLREIDTSLISKYLQIRKRIAICHKRLWERVMLIRITGKPHSIQCVNLMACQLYAGSG